MKKKLSTAEFRKLLTRSINSHLSTLTPEKREKCIREAHATAMELCGPSGHSRPSRHEKDRNSHPVGTFAG